MDYLHIIYSVSFGIHYAPYFCYIEEKALDTKLMFQNLMLQTVRNFTVHITGIL